MNCIDKAFSNIDALQKRFSRLKQKRFNALKKEATKQQLHNKLEKLKKVNIL